MTLPPDNEALKQSGETANTGGSMRRTIEYYVIEPVFSPEPGEFMIASASVGFCGLCGRMACGMGGSNNIVCVPCAEVVMKGQAKGAIKWDLEA